MYSNIEYRYPLVTTVPATSNMSSYDKHERTRDSNASNSCDKLVKKPVIGEFTTTGQLWT